MSIRERIAKAILPGVKTLQEFQVEISTLEAQHKSELEAFEDRIEQLEQRAQMGSIPHSHYDPDGEGYRRLSSTMQRRAQLHVDLQKSYDIMYFMWDSSLIFKSLCTMDCNFIFGEDFKIEAEDQEVQKVIDSFDEENKFCDDEKGFPNWCMWFSILGTQCWPIEINKENGLVRLYYVDPQTIKDIKTDVRDAKRAIRVDMQDTTTGKPGERYEIIYKDNVPMSKTFTYLRGDCFYFAINHPPNDPIGRSDFQTLIDWVDATERFGFNFLERAELALNFIWDVTVEGMNQEELREWARDPMNGPPKPGARRIHNQHVKWEAVAPDLKSADIKTGFEMAKNIVGWGHRRPDNWFGSGGKVYQNEAETMSLVPIKDLSKRQNLYRTMARDVIDFVIDQAILTKRLRKNVNRNFKCNLPEISKKDLTKGSGAMLPITNSLSVAEDRGWIRPETASRIYTNVLNTQLGQEIDTEEEVRALEIKAKEEANKENRDFDQYLKDEEKNNGNGNGNNNTDIDQLTKELMKL